MERLITFPTWTYNSLVTLDDAPTTIATIPIPDLTVIGIQAFVVGRRTDDYSEDGLFAFVKAAFNNLGGTATPIGTSPDIDPLFRTDAAWDVTVTQSGSDALIQVTGPLYGDVNWICRHILYPVSEV